LRKGRWEEAGTGRGGSRNKIEKRKKKNKIKEK
jgi:hypothetical protein